MAIINPQLERVLKVTYEDHLIFIQLSKEQRPKYFEYKRNNIKGGRKPLFKKLIKPEFKTNKSNKPEHLKLPYCVGRFKGSKLIGIYANVSKIQDDIDIKDTSNTYYDLKIHLTKTQSKSKSKDIVFNIQTGEREVSNPTQAGTPKIHIIKGQDFYVGLNEFVRVKVVDEIKAFYYEKFKNIDSDTQSRLYGKLNDAAPLVLHLNIYDTLTSYGAKTSDVRGNRWDVGNKGLPYIKTFSDFITQGYEDFNRILEDDDKMHICSEVVEYTPVASEDERKIVFSLYSDKDKLMEYLNIINNEKEKRRSNRS